MFRTAEYPSILFYTSMSKCRSHKPYGRGTSSELQGKKKSEQKASEIITQALVKVERKVEAKFKLFRLCEDADLTKKKKNENLNQTRG